jgi:hypothetical protein
MTPVSPERKQHVCTTTSAHQISSQHMCSKRLFGGDETMVMLGNARSVGMPHIREIAMIMLRKGDTTGRQRAHHGELQNISQQKWKELSAAEKLEDQVAEKRPCARI